MIGWLIVIAVWIYTPLLFLEQNAERGRDGKYHWSTPTWFNIIVFLIWPVVVPIAIYLLRRQQKGLSK